VFSHKRHTGKLASATAIAASSILSIAAAHAAETTSTQMVLTAYVNAAGGESVLAGKYDAALKEIDHDRSTSSMAYSAKINNLCVTYAAKKQLTEAMSACDEAVKSAKYDRFSSQRYSAGSERENAYVAIAYANRAVVHMMGKDSESAKTDMARARSLAPSAEFVSKNLAVMQTTSSKIAQLDIAPAR
jgi:hypothetical protein